jgi:hypothetical protein
MMMIMIIVMFWGLVFRLWLKLGLADALATLTSQSHNKKTHEGQDEIFIKMCNLVFSIKTGFHD